MHTTTSTAHSPAPHAPSQPGTSTGRFRKSMSMTALVLFGLAYFSTKYFEKFFIEMGKEWLRKRKTSVPKPFITPAPSAADSIIYKRHAKNTV